MTEQERNARVLNALSRRVGMANGIHVRELAIECGIPERAVRSAVEALRLDGVAICAHPSTGYHMAGNADELARTDAFLYSRAMATLKQLARHRGKTMAELLGQLNLNT